MFLVSYRFNDCRLNVFPTMSKSWFKTLKMTKIGWFWSIVECWTSGLAVTDCLCQLCSLKCAQICLKYMKMYVFGFDIITIGALTSVYKRGVWDLPAQKVENGHF